MPSFRSRLPQIWGLGGLLATLLAFAPLLSAQGPVPPPPPPRQWRVFLPGISTPIDSVAGVLRIQLPTGTTPGFLGLQPRDPSVTIDSVRLALTDTLRQRRILLGEQGVGRTGARLLTVQLRGDSLDTRPVTRADGLISAAPWKVYMRRGPDTLSVEIVVEVIREVRGRLTVNPRAQGPVRYVIGMQRDSLPDLGWLRVQDADTDPRRLCIIPDSIQVDSVRVRPPPRCGAASLVVRPIALDSLPARGVRYDTSSSWQGWLDTAQVRWTGRPPLTPDSVRLRFLDRARRDSLAKPGRASAIVTLQANSRLLGLQQRSDSSRVDLRVWARPVLATDQPRIELFWRVGDPLPTFPTITVRNMAVDGPDLPTTLGLDVQLENGPPQWLRGRLSRLTPTPADIQLSFDPTGLVPSDDFTGRLYTAQIRVLVPLTNDTLTIPLQLTVLPPRGTIGGSRTAIAFGQGVRDNALLRDTLTIRNTLPGGLPTALGQLTATVRYDSTTSAAGWLAVRLSSTRSPAVLTLEAQGRQLDRGVYRATVVIGDTTSTNRELLVPVTLRVGDVITLVPETPVVTAPAGAGRGAVWTTQVRVNASQGTLRQLNTRIEILQGPELLTTGTPWIRTRWLEGQTPARLEVTVDAPAVWASQMLVAQIMLISPEARDGEAPLRIELPPVGEGPLRLGRDTLRFGVDPVVPLASQPAQQIQISGTPEAFRIEWTEDSAPIGLTINYPVQPDLDGWIAGMTPGPVIGFSPQATVPPAGRTVVRLRLTFRQSGTVLTVPVVVLVPPRGYTAPELAALLRPRAAALDLTQLAWLDAAGNQNGRADLGDVAAILSRRVP